ncbi:MAG: HD domain-containing phosphohydrolase [Fimbriimonadaceae bacterium]
MDGVGGSVLVLLATATAALAYYLRQHLPRQLDARTRESIKVFSKAVELRFPTHEGLTERVAEICVVVGIRLGLNDRQLRTLDLVAQLRDIGLCAVPYRLINGKSFVRWTETEKEAYLKHAETSANMLEQIPMLKMLAPMVRHHHAPFDEKLPIESRILKVVGDYVWSERWQGEMLARTYLEQGSGKEYDPRIVTALFDVLTSTRAAEPVPELAPAAR